MSVEDNEDWNYIFYIVKINYQFITQTSTAMGRENIIKAFKMYYKL